MRRVPAILKQDGCRRAPASGDNLLDLSPGAVLILASLEDQKRRFNRRKQVFDVPEAEPTTCPGICPGMEEGRITSYNVCYTKLLRITPEIKDIIVTTSDVDLLMFATVKNGFTQEMVNEAKAGTPIVFTFLV